MFDARRIASPRNCLQPARSRFSGLVSWNRIEIIGIAFDAGLMIIKL